MPGVGQNIDLYASPTATNFFLFDPYMTFSSLGKKIQTTPYVFSLR